MKVSTRLYIHQIKIKESAIDLKPFWLIRGLSYREVSEILLLDDETIRLYVKDYIEKNSLDSKHKGSKSFFSIQQSQEVISHLKEKTYLSSKEMAK